MISTISKWGFFAALVIIGLLAILPIEETPISTGWDKLNHLVAFLVLLALYEQAYPLSPVLWKKLLLLFSYGLVIEIMQYFMPPREFSLFDVLANICGLALYFLIRPLVLCYFPLQHSAKN